MTDLKASGEMNNGVFKAQYLTSGKIYGKTRTVLCALIEAALKKEAHTLKVEVVESDLISSLESKYAELEKLMGDAMKRTLPGTTDTGEALVAELLWQAEMLSRAKGLIIQDARQQEGSIWLADLERGPR